MHDLQETRIQGSSMHPLKIYRMEQTSEKIDVPSHWQETVEILLIKEGHLALRIGDRDYPARPGEVYYISPQHLHSMASRDPECLYYAFLFPLSWLQFSENDEASARYLAPLADRTACPPDQIPESVLPAVRGLLEDVYRLYDEEPVGAWLGIKADFIRLYFLLYQAGVISSHPRRDLEQQLLLQIPQFIQEHCAENLTLSRMGEAFHLSPKYFSVFFQKHFDRSFTDYLTAIRMERVKLLLLETGANLEWIAQQTGYSQSGYLIRVFRKTQGMTPLQYRRLGRKSRKP